MRDGPDAGLAAARRPGVAGHRVRLLPTARADLLVRAGRAEEAVPLYRAALAQSAAPAERAQLRRRLHSITPRQRSGS